MTFEDTPNDIAPPSGRPAIEISDLTVAYDETPVLWDIDLEIPSGVIAGVIGPNGAGKSTLIKAILGIVTPAAGSISVLGQSYRKARRRVGYIPQRTSVDWDFPTTVFDVVLMGSYGRLGWIRRPRRRDRDEAMQALEVVGMEQYAGRQIGELSGGQQQRTFVARALLQRSDVYLMDEPFQGVDAVTERALVGILHELKQQGKTLLVVHHDLQTAEHYFDWITMLNVRIITSGPVSQSFTEDNLKTTYGGRMNLRADAS